MGVASRSFGSLSPYGLQLSQDDVLVVGPEWFCERGGPTAPTHGRFVREEKQFYRYGPVDSPGAAIASARSLFEAPRPISERTIRSRDAEGSPASIFATRD